MSTKKKAALHDLPTLDEQQQLQNVDNVLQHSFVNLQVKEVLGEVSSSVYSSKTVKPFVESLVAHFAANASKLNGQTITESWLSNFGAKNVHLQDYVNTVSSTSSSATSSSISIDFEAPAAGLEPVGSFAYKTITAPFVNIDFSITIPSSCFQEKDILNYVYFDKKTLYLSAAALIIQKFASQASAAAKDEEEADLSTSYAGNKKKKAKNGDKNDVFDVVGGLEDSGEVFLTYFKGDFRKPIIVYRPIHHPNKKIQVLEFRFFPVVASSLFRPVQLVASKNNIRPKEWIEHHKGRKGEEEGEGSAMDASVLVSTPDYNSTVAEDMSLSIHRRILSGIFQSSPVAVELAMLFKVWLTQRSLRFGLETFDSHCASLLVCYMIQTKRIHNLTPVADAFQALLKFISDFDKKRTVLNFNKLDISASALEEGASSTVVLLHPIGTREKFIDFNVFWRISDSCFETLIREATKSLKIYEQCNSNAHDVNFQRLFLSSSSLSDREDLVFHVTFSSDYQKSLTLQKAPLDAVPWRYLSNSAYHLLIKGLSDRILSISAITRTVASASVNGSDKVAAMAENYSQPFPVIGDNSTGTAIDVVYTVGVTLHVDNARRKVDRCPTEHNVGSKVSAEEIKEEFVSFWMNKCELRRFNDGTIVEAVVWDGNKIDNNTVATTVNPYNRGTLIVGEIIRFLMSSRFSEYAGENGDNVKSHSLALEWSEDVKQTTKISSLNALSSLNKGIDIMKQCRLAVESLDSLRNLLIQRFEALPLVIEEVLAVDPELRYTSLAAPFPHPAILHAANSKELLKEIQGKKISLLVKPFLVIGRLESSGKWPMNVVAIKNFKRVILIKLMEILKKEHEITSILGDMSLDIFHEGYVFRLLLFNDKDFANAKVSPADCETYLADPYHSYRLVRLSLHHQVIRSLVSAHPVFPDTVRATTRWLNSHYLTDLLSPEIVGLIVASVFLDFYPKSTAPTTAFSAFLQVLNRIHSFQWNSDPLIVDFDNTITNADKKVIAERFEKTGGSESHPLIYIVTSFDRERGFAPLFWDYALSKTELNLLVSCSKSSFEILRRSIASNGASNEDILDIEEFPSVQSVIRRSNVNMEFLRELSYLHLTQSGLVPAFGVVQSFKNAPSSKLDYKELVVRHCFNSHLFVQEQILRQLRHRFDKYALIFWNGNIGDRILVLWKPAMFLPRNFSIVDTALRLPIELPNSSAPKKGGNGKEKNNTISVPNISEILAQLLSSCEGYVDKLEIL